MKILIVGPSGTGKTTLKKVFFEHSNPFEIIQESLEPTLGVETSYYNLGTLIAIHDLAGQQLEDWLSKSKTTFLESDLVIIVFDSQEKWEYNYNLWKNIDKIRNEMCSSAKTAIFFHKIDLLTPNQRFELKKSIKKHFSLINQVIAYSSSIEQDYFLETFQHFISVLKNFFFDIESIDFQKSFTKIEILKQFIKSNSITINNLNTRLGIDASNDFITDLQKLGYLQYKQDINIIYLSEKGKEFINRLKNKIILKVHKRISPDEDFIHGLILAEKNGLAFFTFEHIRNYFNKKYPESEQDTDMIVSLISGYFSAITTFGSELEKKDISIINLSGEMNNIILIRFDLFFGIFFLDKIKVDLSVFKILKEFMIDINIKIRDQIKYFIKTGDLNKFSSYKDFFLQKIKEFNTNLKKLYDLEMELSKSRLYVIYQQISSGDLSQLDIKFLKNLIFKYLLSEDFNVIKKIQG